MSQLQQHIDAIKAIEMGDIDVELIVERAAFWARMNDYTERMRKDPFLRVWQYYRSFEAGGISFREAPPEITEGEYQFQRKIYPIWDPEVGAILCRQAPTQ